MAGASVETADEVVGQLADGPQARRKLAIQARDMVQPLLNAGEMFELATPEEQAVLLGRAEPPARWACAIPLAGDRLSLPSEADIRALHQQFAPTRAAFDLVSTHCRIVCDLAEQVLIDRKLDVDGDLVRVGSLLHDIGVYRLYGPTGELDHANYIRHGVIGHELLQGLGFPDVVCRFASRHTGMGLTREDVRIQGLPIPVADYLPETPEEELVLYADKFHSKTDPPTFVTADSYAASVRRFGADKVARFAVLRERYGEPDAGRLTLPGGVEAGGSMLDGTF